MQASMLPLTRNSEICAEHLPYHHELTSFMISIVVLQRVAGSLLTAIINRTKSIPRGIYLYLRLWLCLIRLRIDE